MKRKDLEKIEGLSKEQIDEILGLHQTDEANWRTKMATKENELATSNQTIKDLNSKLDNYKDVDVEDLKKKNSEWQDKYDNDIAALKKQHAIEVVVKSSKPKNEKALMALLDIDKVTLGDDGKLTGLDEQIKSVKKDNAFLFEDEKQGTQQVNLGGNHSSKNETATFTLGEAVNSHYNEGE